MRIILLICLLSIIGITLNAQLKSKVNICYKRSDGSYSQFYFKEVQLKTGYSLNKSTQSQDYNDEDDYLLNWFGQGEVAIIKLDDPILSKTSRYVSDINKFAFDVYCSYHRNLFTGKDKNGTNWKICTMPEDFAQFCQ